MQRIRKISDLFKKPKEPSPDDFLDCSTSRWDKDRGKAKKQLKHVKSMPLRTPVRTNKPSYRGGQPVPKDKIVYPLIPSTHHVDILESRPSTSSYDTYASEPLDLLPPPSLRLQEFQRRVREEREAERQRSERDKPLPPSPRKPQHQQYATTHGYTGRAAARTAAAQAAPAKPPPSGLAPRREVAKPVPGVVPQSSASGQRKVDYIKLVPPKAPFNMFKPVDRKAEVPKPINFPSSQSPPAAALSSPRAPPADVPKPVAPRIFSDADSDDSLSVYSDQFSMDSVSVMTGEERRPAGYAYVRYHNARTGDEDNRRDPAVNSVDEFGSRTESPRHDADLSLSTSPASVRRQPAVKRQGSSGSLVYQSESAHTTGSKTSYAQDMLARAHKAGAVASLRATPASPTPASPTPPTSAGSSHTRVQMLRDRPPPKQPIPGSVDDFRSRPLEAGIPFPPHVLKPVPVPIPFHAMSRELPPPTRNGR
ncbi:hypothetical protein EIP91_010693, partial [Steccherinum ochraceum]